VDGRVASDHIIDLLDDGGRHAVVVELGHAPNA
jgi:hypothetical protein